MKRLFLALALSALVLPATLAAAPISKWTISAYTGVSVGDQTSESFSWRGAVHHWNTPSVGVGLEFGRLRWEPPQEVFYPVRALSIEPFQGLAKGGHELLQVSGSLKIRGNGQGDGSFGAAPFIELGAGAYRQSAREVVYGPIPWPTSGEIYAPVPNVEQHSEVHPGWHVAVGGMALRGLAPGAEFRFDWVNTNPGPSSYFTASFALHLNAGHRH